MSTEIFERCAAWHRQVAFDHRAAQPYAQDEGGVAMLEAVAKEHDTRANAIELFLQKRCNAGGAK